MTTVPDPDLIAAHLAGDRRAFAAIYDRYAPALYDVARAMTRQPDDAADLVHDTFVIAAQRLGQLRQPDRLRPWLFAVLRHEVYRTGRRRRRETPAERVAEMAPPVSPDPGADLEREALARLVREAAAGLDERDRLVLEMVARQRLEGDDLADALGVTVAQTYSLVHRMRQRFTRAAGAAVVARTGRAACSELDRVLAAWDGRYDVLTRKRVARHVDDCATCQDTRSKAGLVDLFGGLPASALPASLRERVLAGATRAAVSIALDDDGFPRRRRRRSPALVGAAVLAVVLLAAGLGAAVVRPSQRATLGPDGPGPASTAAATTIRPATTPASRGITAEPTPSTGASAATDPTPSTTTVAPDSAPDTPPDSEPDATPPNPPGSSDDGTSPRTTLAGIDPAPPTPPAAEPTVPPPPTVPPGGTTPTTAGSGGTSSSAPTRTTSPRLVLATTTTTVATPVVRLGDPPVTVVFVGGGPCAPTTVTITATILQSAAGVRVTLSWTGPGGVSGTRGMAAGAGSSWSATLGPFAVAGTVTYTVRATNPRGATATSSPRTITVRPCAR